VSLGGVFNEWVADPNGDPRRGRPPNGTIRQVQDMLVTLDSLGYRIFHVELNSYYLAGFEVAFIHESLVKP